MVVANVNVNALRCREHWRRERETVERPPSPQHCTLESNTCGPCHCLCQMARRIIIIELRICERSAAQRQQRWRRRRRQEHECSHASHRDIRLLPFCKPIAVTIVINSFPPHNVSDCWEFGTMSTSFLLVWLCQCVCVPVWFVTLQPIGIEVWSACILRQI